MLAMLFMQWFTAWLLRYQILRECLCVCLTIRKHLNPFLLLVVVARRRALIPRELWTIWVRGGLSWWVQILIGQKWREKEVLRNGTSQDMRAQHKQRRDYMIHKISMQLTRKLDRREHEEQTKNRAEKSKQLKTKTRKGEAQRKRFLTVLLSSLVLVGSFVW